MIIAIDELGMIAAFTARARSAAHSMDTDWFAVDRNGEVALCHSGEEGAVPWDAYRRDWFELTIELVIPRLVAHGGLDAAADRVTIAAAVATARTSRERELLAAIAGGDDASREVYRDWLEQQQLVATGAFVVHDGVVREAPPQSLPPSWDGVLRFAHRDYLEMFRDEYFWVGREGWRPIDPHVMANAVIVAGVAKHEFDDYWESGAIRCGYLIEPAHTPRSLGLYEYQCSFSGPYQRTAAPSSPLVIDRVPQPLRSELARIALKLHFRGTETFDPERYFDCQRYGQ